MKKSSTSSPEKPACLKCALLEKYGKYLEYYGDYKHGLSMDEVKAYLKERNGGKLSGGIIKKFNKIAGYNTCAVGPQGQTLMYRHDVKRFADALFDRIPTYFD